MLYKVPIDFYGFFQRFEMSLNKKQARFAPLLPKVTNLKDSIDQFLELVIFSYPGECKFLNDFGFNFWETQFNNLSVDSFNTAEFPRKQLEDNLTDSIEKFETRLSKVKVEIRLSHLGNESSQEKSEYSVIVSVNGNINKTQSETYSKTFVFTAGAMRKN